MMADPQQLDMLKQGTEVWNTWRSKHPVIRLDLSGADLSGADLNGADLNGADLNGANLIKADLIKAKLIIADLSGANLSGADLSGADLSYADLSYADLSSANLSSSALSKAKLIKAKLIKAKLRGTYLRGTYLSYANLSDADLIKADLSGANLIKADLSGANLNSVDLSGANLSRAIIGRTIFGEIDLRHVKGLETVEHWAPSTIGTDTLLRSEGNIPESFLRGAGLTDTFIDYVRSLSQNAIEYCTCFLSYSSQDDAFVKRLHADLQQHGVRCWFAPHSLRPGDLILAHIGEAIRLHDKLVLILSQHSVESRWVEVEVTTAQTKEIRQNCQMLFPLRLDDTVMSTTTEWARSLREQRHIADFTGWKDHDAYQQAFTHLLRDLQPDTKTLREP